MNTLRQMWPRLCARTSSRANGSIVYESTGGLTNKKPQRSNRIQRKSSGRDFYKNVITGKRDAQYKQIEELESISKSLARQRRNPALKLKQAPIITKVSKKREDTPDYNRKENVVYDNVSPLSYFAPHLLSRAQHLFTKAPLTRRIANSIEQVKEIIFEHHGKRLPEVAIIGRSNVGKSSLLNALLSRDKALTGAL